VIRSLRYVPETENEDHLARRRGSEVKKVEFDHDKTVGGNNTFKNAVFVPEGALAQDKYIAVQVACADADQGAFYEDGILMMEELSQGLSALADALAGNQDALDEIEAAQDGLAQAAIEFQLYSFFSSKDAFDRMRHDVIKKMKKLIDMIEDLELDAQFYPQIHQVTLMAVEATRELCVSAINYGQSLPDANMELIQDAMEKLAEGDINAVTQEPDVPMEWGFYQDAVKDYCEAFRKANRSIRDLDTPCGASVDFLPNQQFEADVTVTLSWEALNFDGDPDSLEIYWLDETTDLWVLVPDPVIDVDDETVSVNIDHFTRYAWASRRLPPPTN
jgi:hypothetical protein